MSYPTEVGLYWATVNLASGFTPTMSNQRPLTQPGAAPFGQQGASGVVPQTASLPARNAAAVQNLVVQEEDAIYGTHNAVVEVYAIDEVMTANGIVPAFGFSVNIIGSKRLLGKQPRKWKPSDIEFGPKIEPPA